MEKIIREANAGDIQGMVNNRIDFQHELGCQPDEEFIRATREYFCGHMEDDSFICYIALKDDQIIASVIICLYDVIPTTANVSGKVGYVFNVYTLKEFRGQGLATGLLERSIKEAKSRGAGELFLEAQDAGKGVYEHLGFQMLQREMHLDLT